MTHIYVCITIAGVSRLRLLQDRVDSLRVDSHLRQQVQICCSVLQRVAVNCSVLQRIAVCCSVLQCVAGSRGFIACGFVFAAAGTNVLQHVAVCCSVLQCVAVCCSELQDRVDCLRVDSHLWQQVQMC